MVIAKDIPHSLDTPRPNANPLDVQASACMSPLKNILHTSKPIRLQPSLHETSPHPAKAEMLWEEQGSPLMWENFVATQATANEHIDQSEFTLQFPPGIEIYDFRNGRGTKRNPITQK
jgi:hypothetical protein